MQSCEFAVNCKIIGRLCVDVLKVASMLRAEKMRVDDLRNEMVTSGSLYVKCATWNLRWSCLRGVDSWEIIRD